MTMNFNLNSPTNLLFGAGSLQQLGSQTMPGKKALLLLSAGKSAKVSGALDKTQEQLEKAGVEYVPCAIIKENPTKDLVMEAAGVAKEKGCDFIVALGGGAVLDSSVAVAAMATNPGDLWDYVVGGTGKAQPLANDPLPIVTITLTAGTGSEINNWGVISKLDTHEKIGFGGDPRLVPVLAIVDPELMKTVPPKYTAYQGFDALFHNTEVMMSKGVNILSETIALSAIENIAQIPASRGAGRQRPGSARTRRLWQHHGRDHHAADLHHGPAQHGARHERLSPQPAPRRGPDHDFPGFRGVLHRAPRLRRAIHQDGPRHGNA